MPKAKATAGLEVPRRRCQAVKRRGAPVLWHSCGDKLPLWGGVASHTLCMGTEEDVRQEARHAVRHCAPGGGFIMGSSHSVMVAAKPENFLAMVNETQKAGRYPSAV